MPKAVSQIFIDGLTRQAVDLRKLEDSAARAVTRVLEEARVDILADLADRAAKRQLSRTGSTLNWRMARHQEVVKNIDATLATAYGKIGERAGKRMQDAAAFGFESTAKGLGKGLGGLATANTVSVGPELLERIARDSFIHVGTGAAPVAAWWADQEAKLAQGLARSFRAGMIKGDGVPELARRLQATSGEVGIPIAKRWAEAVARTGVQSTAREARMQTFAANRHVVKGFYHFSTLDKRTTVICIAYSGKAFLYTEDGSVIPDGHSLPYGSGVPRHISCRSTELPILKTWEEQGFDEDELSPGLRRRFSAKSTGPRGDLNDALKANPDLARKRLGPTRYDLWKSGRAKLDDFVDPQTGQARSVRELREMFANGGKPPTVKPRKAPKPTALPKEKTLSGPEIRERYAAEGEDLDRRIEELSSDLREMGGGRRRRGGANLSEEQAKKVEQVRAQISELRDQRGKLAINMIGRGKGGAPIKANVRAPADLLEGLTETVEEVMEDVGTIWGRKLPRGASVDVVYDPKVGRSFFEPGKVTVGRTDSIYRSVAHEVGHWLEDMDDDAHRAVVDFYRRRTSGYPQEAMGQGYGSGEVTTPDDFIHKYMGKAYPDGKGGIRMTELLSMGVEWMLTNPTDLMTRDADMFDFLVDLLRGAV